MGPSPQRPGRRDVIVQSLRQRIVAGLHLGTVSTGDRLPSLRVLAAEFQADPRVVLAAYREIAREGLVRLVPRSGVFAETPPARGADVLPDVAQWVLDIFLRGLRDGIAPAELRRQARACLDTVRVRVACFECNHDQIHALCTQLRDDYGFDVASAAVEDLDHRTPLPEAVAGADLIVTTGFHIPQAQRLGRRLKRPVIVATLDSAFVTEVRRLLAAGPVWWICTDPRFAAKLPRMFPGSPVTPVVLSGAALETVPEDALVYATRRAAERLPRTWHRGRVVTMTRVFSAATARALLEFRVRRNLEAIARRRRARSLAGKPVARRPSRVAAGVE
jgi:hypothetical protein